MLSVENLRVSTKRIPFPKRCLMQFAVDRDVKISPSIVFFVKHSNSFFLITIVEAFQEYILLVPSNVDHQDLKMVFWHQVFACNAELSYKHQDSCTMSKRTPGIDRDLLRFQILFDLNRALFLEN